MKLKTISLHQYRNLAGQNISFGDRVNVFIGDNGQGKTNLLEAIYLLLKGESFRPSNTGILINNKLEEEHKAQVKAQLVHKHLQSEVAVQLEQKRKGFFLNKKKISATRLASDFPVVIFSPESLSAIKEGPELRRQLIDDFLITGSAENARIISEYRKCLKSRNQLLRQVKQKLATRSSVEPILDSIDESFVKLSKKHSFLRIQGLRTLLPFLKTGMKFISENENVDISVDYLISGQSSIAWDENQVYDAHLKRLKELRNSEFESGTSLVGSHKHDIRFLMNGQDSRYFCSQGQQRAIVLSFKMAHVKSYFNMFNEYPVLLLDDVLSELDKRKRNNLIEFLSQIESQIFITTTDLEDSKRFVDQGLKLYEVDSGRINENQP